MTDASPAHHTKALKNMGGRFERLRPVCRNPIARGRESSTRVAPTAGDETRSGESLGACLRLPTPHFFDSG
jgi:hypothetical protein